MTEVTQILQQMELGEATAEELLPLVYDELRQLAALQMAQEHCRQTLQPTALVHEAFLRLTGESVAEGTWENRRHFFGAAARAMQRILVDQARRKQRLKHGGDRQRVPLPDSVEDRGNHVSGIDLLALDDALQLLQQEDAQKAELVRLRYFVGLEEREAAVALGISRATAARWWAYARAWLYDQMYGRD